MRSYSKPPEKVRMTLEALFLLLKSKKLEWNEIKIEMTKSDFINSIINFDVNKISEAIWTKVKSDYLDKDNWNLEAINISSKAAGPLAEWLES